MMRIVPRRLKALADHLREVMGLPRTVGDLIERVEDIERTVENDYPTHKDLDSTLDQFERDYDPLENGVNDELEKRDRKIEELEEEIEWLKAHSTEREEWSRKIDAAMDSVYGHSGWRQL